jgi:homogentisate 1,2-dioxygenase
LAATAPRKCPCDLYAEQLSGSPFTAPRIANITVINATGNISSAVEAAHRWLVEDLRQSFTTGLI